jgi:PHD/YefM family antitoxin component YafN of YafNO toxin-antitoxin module
MSDKILRVSVVQLKSSLGDILNKVEFKNEVVVIHRRDKEAAALVPMSYIEHLIRELEDKIDSQRIKTLRQEDRITRIRKDAR